MNKGQLPLLGVIGIVGLIVLRMTPEKVDALAQRIIDALENGSLVGYFLLVVTIAAWYLQARSARIEFSTEFRRIGVEKSDVQSKAAGEQFQSSDEP